MDSQTLTIRELAKKTGVSSKALRYWESRRLLPMPGRTHTGYRMYPVNVIQKVQFIRKAKSVGFTLSEILSLLALAQENRNPCEAVDAWASRKVNALDHQIAVLAELRHRLQEYRRRWLNRRPPASRCSDEICCLIEELPISEQERR